MYTAEIKFHRGSWLVTIALVAIAVIHITFVFFPGQKMIALMRTEIASRQLYIGDSDKISAELAASQQELLEAKSYIENWQHRLLWFTACRCCMAISTIYAKKLELPPLDLNLNCSLN